jgi:hypothetical protein
VGFRQNPYGKFTVNIGVYVPELHAYGYTGGGKLAFIHEYDVWVGERLGILGPERQDLWWDLKAVHEQAAEVFRRIERDAFLSSQSSKEKDTDFSRFTCSRAEPCLCNCTENGGMRLNRYFVQRGRTTQIIHLQQESAVFWKSSN